MNPLDALGSAMKSGWRTSEFWLSILGMGAAVLLPHADQAVGAAGDKIAQHGTVGAIAAGAIAGAYAVGRSIVKANTARGILEPVAPPVIPPLLNGQTIQIPPTSTTTAP